MNAIVQPRTNKPTPATPTGVTVEAFLQGIASAGSKPGEEGQAAATIYEATLVVQLNATDLPAFTALADKKGFLRLVAMQRAKPNDFMAP